MKKIFTLLFAVFGLASGINSQILTDGLIAYYPFNGNANDESGHNLNGEVFGAVLSEDRNGIPASAYYFDGLDDYIEVRNMADSIFESEFAISLWCKFSDFENNYPCLIGGDNNYIAVAGTGPIYHDDMSKIAAYQGFNDQPDNRRIPSMFTRSKLVPGIYYNVIFMSNGDSAFIYLDGMKENAIKVQKAIPVIAGNKLFIGMGYQKETTQSFRGYIDDIRIYNRALSSDEVLCVSSAGNEKLTEIEGENEVCQGQNNVGFHVQPIACATNYTWSYSGTGASLTSVEESVSIDFTGSATGGDLSVSVTDVNSETQSVSIPIVVNTAPSVAGAISGENDICTGQNSVPYYVASINNATSYLWDYSGTGAAITGNSNIISIDFSDDATGGILTVAGVNNCGIGPVSEAFSIKINSCLDDPNIINIPNAFSPNGDGINDVFIIRGLTENSSVMIFDRSGKILYESDNYQNDWDGKDNKGNALESDTYWYIIHISGIPTEFKGFVYLKR